MAVAAPGFFFRHRAQRSHQGHCQVPGVFYTHRKHTTPNSNSRCIIIIPSGFEDTTEMRAHSRGTCQADLEADRRSCACALSNMPGIFIFMFGHTHKHTHTHTHRQLGATHPPTPPLQCRSMVCLKPETRTCEPKFEAEASLHLFCTVSDLASRISAFTTPSPFPSSSLCSILYYISTTVVAESENPPCISRTCIQAPRCCHLQLSVVSCQLP